MMRRARWLAVGAVLGAVGYRRVDRAAKSLTGQLAAESPTVRSAAGLAARAAGWLVRGLGHSLSGERSSAGGLASFARDVRVGIDEYLDHHEGNINRHHTRSGNTLIGQHPQRSAPSEVRHRQRHHSQD